MSSTSVVWTFVIVCCVVAKVKSFDLTFVQRPWVLTANKCAKDSTILNLIHSHAKRREFRDAIRETWANQPNFLTVFVLARSGSDELEESTKAESEQFGDILKLDFLDSYKNLTFKHASAYRWAIENCPDVQYILKADDDTFVDTLHLPRYIQAFDMLPSTSFILCYVQTTENPIRNPKGKNSKWFLDLNEYPRDDFPNFCAGAAYLTTLGAIKLIYEQLSDTPFLFIDDVLLTGLVVENLPSIIHLDWKEAFLSRHESDRKDLLDPKVGFYSPLFMVAMDLKPVEMRIIMQKAQLCASRQAECYDLIHKSSELQQFRPPIIPRKNSWRHIEL
ncbi:beta-1,3-galactosyltransferase 5-like [Tigriopus californicus]|uniref:beta-1,3-galactosyltransferase 5-like n=1 Tax=Tigriopus californicus TaxID=6832 RepID=UPI0027D9F572|nr:beta-1,3-galactosyltransferase 5-like [Tigriopus californicus]